MTRNKGLKPDFFDRPADSVARDLLGCTLRTNLNGSIASGRIVETEAYMGPEDPASHSYGGLETKRNASMFRGPGTVYVYFIYGMHYCFNAVTREQGFPAAVLIRALEPLTGIKAMEKRRGMKQRRLLCSGPARLCESLGIDARLDGARMPGSSVSILEGSHPTHIETGPRIGISRARAAPLRFFEADSEFLSK